jgi:hypothetical protein
MAGVDEIIKAWVERVEATGELRNDPKFGKPFDFGDGWESAPAEWRMAFKILANAGYTPPGFEAFGRLAELREKLATSSLTDDEANVLRAEMAALEHQIALMKERFGR